MSSNMFRRVAFAVVAIPLVVAVVWLGDWPLAVLLAIAAVLGTNELFHLAERTGVAPLWHVGRFLSAAVPLFMLFLLRGVFGLSFLMSQWGLIALLVVLGVISAAVFVRTPEQRPLAAIAITLFAPIYTAALPSTLFLVRHAQWSGRSWPGTSLVFFPLVVTWVCDSAAMFGGRAIGGAKMAPTISPGKTWAGGVSGVVAGVAVGALYAALLFPRAGMQLGLFAAMALALAISITGQIGDLAESLIKREAGVKDSSALIPGHGGVLDRLDSLYFAIPIAAAGYHLLGLI